MLLNRKTVISSWVAYLGPRDSPFLVINWKLSKYIPDNLNVIAGNTTLNTVISSAVFIIVGLSNNQLPLVSTPFTILSFLLLLNLNNNLNLLGTDFVTNLKLTLSIKSKAISLSGYSLSMNEVTWRFLLNLSSWLYW